MKNIVDNKSPSVTRKYFEKGFGDRAKRLVFGYRTTTDTEAYLNRVLEGVKKALDTGRSVHVYLVFVKGISKGEAQEVVKAVTDGIADVEKSFDETFIRVSPFIDITPETIQRLEGGQGERHKTSVGYRDCP